MILDEAKNLSFSPDDMTTQNAESFMYIMEMMPNHLKEIFLDGETDCSVFFDICMMWTIARDTKSQHLQDTLNNLLYWNVSEDDSLTDKEKADIAELQKFFIELKEKEDFLPSGAMEALDQRIRTKIISRKPNYFTMLNTKASNFLFDCDPEHDFSEVRNINVGGKGKEVLISLQSFVSVAEQLLPATLTPYDGEVMNGICTLLENEQYYFTDGQVYEAFTGKTTKSKTALEKVNQSIRKMRHTDINLNWAAHARQKGLDLPEDFTCVVGKYLLPVDYYDFSLNGQVVKGYKLIQVPALYEYAKAVKQLQTINNRKLLDVGISNTEDTITIKNYLLRRIGSMKNPHAKIANTIVFDTVFKACGLEVSRVEKSRKIKTIYTMLESWIKQGYIKAYEKRTGKKNEAEAVIITV